MLGEVLINADRNKFKGGYLNLFKDIEKAKKEYRYITSILNEFDNLPANFYCALFENKSILFLLQTHKDYQAIIDNIFHNFDYFVKHFNLISEWLFSDDFYQKYKKENHPYPPLLNPDILNELLLIECDEEDKQNLKRNLKQQALKLSREALAYINANLDYRLIPAEMAWEMNLPLPNRYDLIWLWVACSGTMAMYTFFNYTELSVNNVWGWEEERKVYMDNYIYLLNKSTHVAIAPRVFKDNDKIYYLFTKKATLLYICRDPISVIRHAINHIGDQNNKINPYMKNINFHSDINTLFPEIHFVYSNSNQPTLETLSNVIDNYEMYFKANKRINIIKKTCKNILCFDIREISASNAPKTFEHISNHIFNKQITDYSLFTKRINRHQGDLVVLPVIYSITIDDIHANINITTKNLIYFNSLENIKSYENCIDITKEIFENRKLMFDNIILLIKNDEYKILKENPKLFLASKDYLNSYMDALEKHEQKIKNNLITEEQILNYLRERKDLRLKLKNILDEDLTYVKQNHLEYIKEWKYYQEFEKMCENN